MRPAHERLQHGNGHGAEMTFTPAAILRSAVGPHDAYCVGFRGEGTYMVAMALAHGAFAQTFTHPGSDLLDGIIAYDRAEVDGPYLGQINMTTASSFCGPMGLIWGYDVARVELPAPAFLSVAETASLGVEVKDAANLCVAAQELFGRTDQRHFPFIPGTHVPCARKWRVFEGPGTIYSAAALGVPIERDVDACVLMEDVGRLDAWGNGEASLEVKRRLFLDLTRSVIEIGKNQRVQYAEILIAVRARQIAAGEIGCALVAAPYLQLARDAYDERLPRQTLEQWTDEKSPQFACRR